MRRSLFVVLFGIGLLLLGPPASAQTPDSFTPAVEEACTKYEGQGARQGLCIAYCEAQDCDNTKGSNPSCSAIAARFISYSIKQGYVSGPKDKPAISCGVTACSKEDSGLCGGKELDCTVNGACQQICTASFKGFDVEGTALCAFSVCGEACVGKDPVK